MPDSTEMTATEADLQARALDALLEIVRTANAPETREAQLILLRRLALQGDVIASRIPPPRNITEIGGYVNLLGTLSQPELRAQMLAGVLGVAGPNPPLGWTASAPPLAQVTLPNDRPPGASQPAVPLTIAVRSDFAAPLQAALAALHAQGALLPLYAPLRSLPAPEPAAAPPADVLPYLARVVQVVPATALRDADADPVALARPSGSGDPLAIVARSSTAAAQSWEVVECTATACAMATVSAPFIPVAPVLADAGFYPASPLPEPTSDGAVDWARLTNTTGLIAGLTTLGDELRLLYGAAEILASAFAPRLTWIWNGTAFVAP